MNSSNGIEHNRTPNTYRPNRNEEAKEQKTQQNCAKEREKSVHIKIVEKK